MVRLQRRGGWGGPEAGVGEPERWQGLGLKKRNNYKRHFWEPWGKCEYQLMLDNYYCPQIKFLEG